MECKSNHNDSVEQSGRSQVPESINRPEIDLPSSNRQGVDILNTSHRVNITTSQGVNITTSLGVNITTSQGVNIVSEVEASGDGNQENTMESTVGKSEGSGSFELGSLPQDVPN